MKRVLYLAYSLAGGGAERVVVEHLRRLSRERFRPELALFCKDGPLLGEVPADVAVHELRAPGLTRLWRRRRALRRLLKERAFDAVVSHLPYCDLVSLLEDWGRRAPVPRVCVIHGDLRRLRVRGRQRFGLAVLRRLYRRAAQVVFLTETTAEYMRPTYGLAPERTAVVPNGVDRARLAELASSEAPPEWPGGGLRLLAVGRLEKQKGFDVLLRAFAAARRGGLDASLLILGEGSERARLAALAEGPVAMPGYRSNPFPAMRHADLLVHASRWEGFGLVLLEALALGLPVLATDCPAGPGELLRDGAGHLVPPDDADALAAALLQLAAAPDRRGALAEAGLARSGGYAWDRVIRELERVLQKASS